MSRVIIFYPHIGEYGGIERNIIALAAEISQRGQIATLLCYYDKINLRQYSNNQLDVIVLKDDLNPFVKGFRLKKWLSKNEEIIAGLPIFFGAKAGFYAVLGGVKRYALHYTDPPSLLYKAESSNVPGVFTLIKKYFSDKVILAGVVNASHCLTMTYWNARELKALYGRDFDVIHQGGVPPVMPVKEKSLGKSRQINFFSICRISPSKNLSWILDFAGIFLRSEIYLKYYDNINIVIGGKGPDLERLKALAIENNIADYVQFPGFLTMIELEQQYQNADIFLVPGKQGYGLPILEALYREVPVILNRESRISEILNDNPWVSISDNSSESFVQEALTFINKLHQNYPNPSALESLPTEKSWASAVGVNCKWWQ